MELFLQCCCCLSICRCPGDVCEELTSQHCESSRPCMSDEAAYLLRPSQPQLWKTCDTLQMWFSCAGAHAVGKPALHRAGPGLFRRAQRFAQPEPNQGGRDQRGAARCGRPKQAALAARARRLPRHRPRRCAPGRLDRWKFIHFSCDDYVTCSRCVLQALAAWEGACGEACQLKLFRLIDCWSRRNILHAAKQQPLRVCDGP